MNSKDVDDKLRDAASTHQGDVPASVSDARVDGHVVRCRGRAERQGDRLVADAVGVSDAQRRRARCSDVPVENVRVIFTRGSGCYGINGADTVSYDAALLSQAVGRPVRVQLSRKDEMAWENYGFPYVIDERVGVDASGTIVAWDTEAWFASLGGRPGYDTPGNVVTGMLAGFRAAPFTPRRRRRTRAANSDNDSNAAPSYVAGRVGGRAGGTGTVASERVLTHTVASPFFTGPLRSPSRLQNTFAHESFMDEIAAHVKADPVEYRLRHLTDARLKAGDFAGGEGAPAGTHGHRRRPGAPRTGVVTGRGISCVAYEGDNGYVAMVARSRSIRPPARSRRSGSSWRRTAGRSRTPTACAIRSKAARCRA